MKKLSMQTPNITAENIAKIAELFPHVTTEKEGTDGITTRAIDFELLRQTLSDALADTDSERYRLDWPGKKASLLKANTPITKTLRPDRESSLNFDTTENVFIEGDNFEVLKVLQESYLGKIKMIYIDPPYNTGKDFVYKDKFTKSKDEYEEEIGLEDEEGGKLFRNTDTNGRFHSDWLSMMYERLLVARDLLKDDGVIFISIDDNEVTNLRKIADEIFGEGNFLADIIWEGNGKNDSRFVSIAHENIILYAKDKNYLITKDISFRAVKEGVSEIFNKVEELCLASQNDYRKVTEELRNWFQSLNKNHPSWQHRHYSSVDSLGVYFPGDISAESGRGRDPYDVKHPITGKNCKMPERGWPTKDTMSEWVSANLVDFGPDETYVPKRKRYLKDTVNYVLSSVIYKDSRNAYKNMLDMFDVKIFDNPKDVNVLQKYVEVTTKDSDVILDFFAGSSTTAHAVMQLNAEDGGSRKFIMVQIPEETDVDSEAYKAGYTYISDISKERIRRAGKKILEENVESLAKRATPLDIGFRAYKADTTNMKDVYYHPSQIVQDDLFNFVSNIKEDRTPEDLLTQVILDLGFTLDLRIEKKELQGNAVYFVAGNALVACFDNSIDFGIVDDIAQYEPLKVVFKDASFKEEQDRTNVETRMKRLSPKTTITVL